MESVHGTYGGAETDVEAIVDPPIIGIPLDGSDGVMEIADTDGGELDGDTEWDRAVGPMQFIPETWQHYAQDGNLDGETDPQQIDDAALTAAVYLCDSSDDLTDDEGWPRAITAYNGSLSYAEQVAERAEEYGGTLRDGGPKDREEESVPQVRAQQAVNLRLPDRCGG